MRKSLLKSVLTHIKGVLLEILTTDYLVVMILWMLFIIMLPTLGQVGAFFVGLPLLCTTLYLVSDPDYESPDDDSDFDGRA